ncbi:S53 family peptidase [Sorangium sp. So ce388]|uniref:S53 family peptidase n=1 Tax=Sorangium sp. So ce388 TaxID=3133309 RepID=UPI003F5C0C0C
MNKRKAMDHTSLKELGPVPDMRGAHTDAGAAAPLAGSPAASDARFTALDLARLYNFPPGLDGSGQKIGVILPGGGLPVEVLDTYFARLGLKVPKIEIIQVDGAKNEPSPLKDVRDFILQWGLERPSRPAGRAEGTRANTTAQSIKPSWNLLFTMEILMDVEILGAVANGAEIRVYRTPADLKGIYNAILQAARDGVTILSNSWGGAEGDMIGWIEKIERALRTAVEAGVTILFASGDNGSTPSGFESEQTKLQPCYPASSPWVVACGGTAVELAYRGAPHDEVVWNEPALGRHLASGGGFSHSFPRPDWQTGVSGDKRGVPDISANAAVQSGVWLWFGEVEATAFGTSAAVQLLAGLTACLYQGLGFSVPNLNEILYRPGVREAMRPIAEGNNIIRPGVEGYGAAPGWNACAGLGRPDGVRLLKALREHFGLRDG